VRTCGEVMTDEESEPYVARLAKIRVDVRGMTGAGERARRLSDDSPLEVAKTRAFASLSEWRSTKSRSFAGRQIRLTRKAVKKNPLGFGAGSG
jgi:hypothetical protein